MKIPIISIEEGKVTLSAENDTIMIAGEIDQVNPGEFMETFFATVNEQSASEGQKVVKIDLSELQFLNSSGIRELLKWIISFIKLDQDKSNKIVFLYNPAISWQPISVPMLCRLAPDQVLYQEKPYF
jgi:hypothetical protein